jgi:cell division protein FtsA
MHGSKLEARVLFIVCLKQHLNDIIKAVEDADIEVLDVIASPIAASMVSLSKSQKIAGCILMDIGAETVSTCVFENNLPISVMVFPIGSMDITKDIALGLKISLDEAESIKLGSVTGGDYSKKKIDEIIEARLSDMFELVGNQLKRLKRNELLPAGIIITGNGSAINNIEQIARTQLKLPSKIGPADSTLNNKYKIRDASWYTAVGLALSPIDESENNLLNNSFNSNVNPLRGISCNKVRFLNPIA